MTGIRYRDPLQADVSLNDPSQETAQVGGYVSGADNAIMAPGTADMSSLHTAQYSMFDSSKAALQESLAARAIRGAQYMAIPSEEGFIPAQALGDRMAGYTAEELEFLGDARSTTELAQREAQVGTTRQSMAEQSANPLTAMATSLLDVDLVLGFGVGKLVTAGRTARIATSLAANSAVLGLASQGGTVTPLEMVASSLGAVLSAVPSTRARPVSEVAADVQEAVPVKPTPDPDYVVPKPDTVSTRTASLDMPVLRGADTSTASAADVVGRVLQHGADLPEGLRGLGDALHAALRSGDDVPVVFHGKAGRDSVKLHTDGTVRVDVHAGEAGLGRSVGDTIKNMTPAQRSIVLHEAAHVHTIKNITAWERGTLPSGPVREAIERIDGLRQHATGVLKGKLPYNVKYGLSNNHEFISQLFNSKEFRDALAKVRTPDAPQGFLREVLRKVVQAFTGKASTDTVLDSLTDEFTTLLQHPADASVAAARPVQPVPVMQYAPFTGAKTPKELADKVLPALNRNVSLYDRLKSFGTASADLADRLVVDGAGTEAASATHVARNAYLAANVAMVQVDAAFAQGMASRGWNLFSRVRHPKRYKEAQRELSNEAYAKIAENQQAYRNGESITEHSDAAVQRIVQAFQQSKWAEDSLARVKGSGMLGAENIASNPWYLPRRHSGKAVSEFLLRNSDVTREDIAGMYASQFQRMFASSGMKESTARKLGNQMLRNMEERAAGVSGYRQHIAGMSGDDIEFAMRNAGIDEDQIASFLNTAKEAGKDASTSKQLRRRSEFDMLADYTTKSGKMINPQMFVDKDVMGLMDSYSRNMAGRIGIAEAGFPDLRDLVREVDHASAAASDPKLAREALDNTINQLLGHPTGEDVPDILRSFNAASGLVNLANSGVYQLADAAMMMKTFGITKVLKNMSKTKFGQDALKVAQSKEYGSRLRDVIMARNVLSGRYRSVMTHLDDNTDIGSLPFTHQMIQHFGQGTRFANGMEFMRRGQIKLMSGLVADTMDDAIKGNAKAATMLERFGLDADTLAQARAAMKADPDLRMWPEKIRNRMEYVGQNMSDSLVQENRLGEIPGWMQFSTVGKIILPYMSFVAGSWNKILRRTVRQEGAVGIAQLAAYQIPLQIIASSAVMAMGGKEITPSTLSQSVATQIPLVSWLGFAADTLTNGPSSSVSALSIVDKMHKAFKGIATGDASAEQLIKATPFVSVIPGMRLLGSAIDDE